MITKEMLAEGCKRWTAFYEALDTIADGDGTKETAIQIWRNLSPNVNWQGVEIFLLAAQKNGEMEGINIVDKRVVEPIRPVLTEKGLEQRAKMTDWSFVENYQG